MSAEPVSRNNMGTDIDQFTLVAAVIRADRISSGKKGIATGPSHRKTQVVISCISPCIVHDFKRPEDV